MYNCIHTALSQWRPEGSCKIRAAGEGDLKVIRICLQHKRLESQSRFLFASNYFSAVPQITVLFSLFRMLTTLSRETNLLSVSVVIIWKVHS